MVIQNVLHMNPGNGETSYANNSIFQKMVILKTRPALEYTLKNLYDGHGFSECLKIADLGCSSGPNVFLVMSEIIDTVLRFFHENNTGKAPLFQISLNDLPENDFNTIFKSLPSFHKKLKEKKGNKMGPCFVSGVPGSFYDRLFPSKSLHFVHSSYSLHWLSQVPQNLENKGNIYIARTSPPRVFEIYLKQFQSDFSTFLSLRSEEMMPGGCMLLTFIGRSNADPITNDCCGPWDLLAKSLLDMVPEGLIQADDVDSFDIPLYTPYKDEVQAIVQRDESFNLERLEVFDCNWDANDNEDDENYLFDKIKSGENLAKIIRAVVEPMVASHFGETIVDDLFKKFAKHVGDHLGLGKTKKQFNIVVSLSKKYH